MDVAVPADCKEKIKESEKISPKESVSFLQGKITNIGNWEEDTIEEAGMKEK